MLKILCIDIEGGHGGSSRSLFFALSKMLSQDVELSVWCRRPGPLEQEYAALGITCRVVPALPAISSLPRLSRNLWVYGRLLSRGRQARPALEALAHAAAQVDLVHFNHEGLYLAADWLRRHVDRPATAHVRTMLTHTWFARRQAAMLSAATRARVFITENERDNFVRLGGDGAGAVIYNPVDITAPQHMRHAPVDDALRVACLSNYSHQRGIDRLIDIACAVPEPQRQRLRFVVAGDTQVAPRDARSLGYAPGQLRTLEDYAVLRGVADCFEFLGHVPDPERVLASCHVLAKPTREYNPWGRDILEALAAGLPVLSVGTYARFVETGKTGLLQPEFDAREAADWLLALAADDGALVQYRAHSMQRVSEFCESGHSAEQLLALWQQAATSDRR